MKELLITGAWRCGEQQVQALEQMGYAVTFWPDERQAVNMDTQRFEAVICGGLFLTTPIERFPALKCIQVTSAGLDRRRWTIARHMALPCITLAAFTVRLWRSSCWAVFCSYIKRASFCRKSSSASVGETPGSAGT